ncbi:hypothetical protein D3C80_1408680 [compost metagenome]
MPELVEQAVPRRHQPRQGLGFQRDAFAGFRERQFLGEERQRRAHGRVQPGEAAAQGGAAVLQPFAPDLIEHCAAFIERRAAVLGGQAEAHAGLAAAGKVSEHPVALAFRRAQVATYGAPGGGHVKEQLALAAQLGHPALHQAEAPFAAQAIAQATLAGFRQGQAGLVGRDLGRLLAFLFLVPCIDRRRQRHRAGGRQSRHEASSGETHNLSVSPLGPCPIKARTSGCRGNLAGNPPP